MTPPHSGSSLDALLRNGQIELTGEFVWGSNYTFQVHVSNTQDSVLAVYKPARGERPLWDFSDGSLAAREVAAFEASQTLGWDLVPQTVLRKDGPEGEGSVQVFIEGDYEHHYFEFDPAEKQRLRPVAAFDLLVNNADRKGGHILFDREGHLWLIDHGLTFHQAPKLRTVVWDFAGETIPDHLMADIEDFSRRLRDDSEILGRFEALITAAEIEALKERADALIQRPIFPPPGPGRPYPWPMI